jgi:hypothetical protein
VATAPKFSPEQLAVAREVSQVLDEAGASPRVRLSAFEALWVESHSTNPHGGDRDSQGAFQQRPSQGWGTPAQVTNVRHAAESYVKRAIAANKTVAPGPAGNVAQKVQGSAFPGRYHANRRIALALMQAAGGAGPSAPGSTRGGGSLAADLARPDGFDGGGGMASPMQVTVPSQPAVTPPAAPNAPQVTMPSAYPGAPMAGSPASLAPQTVDQAGGLPDYSQALDGAETGQDAAESTGSAGGQTSTSSGAPGKVVIAPGANTAGKPLRKPLLGVLDTLSASIGRPVKVTTGTNHSALTVDGRPSQHATGDGADLAMTGKRLTRTAAEALLTFAEGKRVQWLRNDGSVANVRVTAANAAQIAASGGIWNVTYQGAKLQLIANTHQGGDHTNHLHVGYAG